VRILSTTNWATLKAKLAALVITGVAFALAADVFAHWMGRQGALSVAAIYEDTILPLAHLQRIEAFVREVELRIPGVAMGMFSGPGSKAYVDSALPEVRRSWARFKGQARDDKTAGLVNDLEQAWGKFEAVLPRLQAAFAAEDKKTLEDLGSEWLDLKPTLLKPLAGLLGAARTATEREVETAQRRQRQALWTSLIAGALLVVIMLPLGVILARGILRPIRRAMALFDDLARGEGDLTTRLDAGSRDELGRMAASFNTFMDTLQTVITRVKETTAHVAAAAQQLSGTARQLSAGAQEQASSLEETAASLEEMTGTVKQNADNARQANQLAMGSRDTAERGGQVVTTAVAAMEEINRASKKIADIITTIDEIAFQTNLLALNAAVEAARAGEQGRGFAVVAAEVRNLAQRSAAAAKEIGALIQDSVAKVATGSGLVNRSGQALGEIVASVKRVTDIMAEIAAASQEQSSGIDQVNRAVMQMDQVTQANAAQTEELSSTAQALAAQAGQLQALVGRFRLDTGAPGAREASTIPPPRAGAPAASRAPRQPRPAAPELAAAVPAATHGSVRAPGGGLDDF
jgi:methyl-accepting chemotaxis protein